MAQVQISIGGVDLLIEDEDEGYKKILKDAKPYVFDLIKQANDEIERRVADLDEDEEEDEDG